MSGRQTAKDFTVAVVVVCVIAALAAGVRSLDLNLNRYEPVSLSEVRGAVANVPYEIGVRQAPDIGQVRVFRGRASDGAVSISFVLLSGEKADALVQARRPLMLNGVPNIAAIGLDAGEGRLIMLESSERFADEPRARQDRAFEIGFAIEEALTELE